MNPDLPPGLYDLISTGELRERLITLDLQGSADLEPMSREELLPRLTRQLSKVFSEHLVELLNEKSPETWRAEIEGWLRSLDEPGHVLPSMLPDAPLALTRIKPPGHQLIKQTPLRPDTPLAVSALLTGSSRSPALRSQLQKELATCDRADWLVSFVRWSGLLPLMETLRRFTETPAPDGGPRLRLATTSYMGATDPKAIEELLKLPNVEIRVSYDTKRTRLHAKAYLFHRLSGFGSAYIGSANISKAALDEGLEWTAKVSQYELPYLWNHAIATFDSHWEDNTEFRPCSSLDLPELRRALKAEKTDPNQVSLESFFDFQPHEFQRAILEDIADERRAGERRHLIIAATGTGKTMIAAFDYRSQCQAGTGRPKLLFLAHRQEILQQALSSFRHVLRDHSFGEIKTGHTEISQLDHIFCTVQSWNSQGYDRLAPDHFAYVVLDEAHHASATSYQRIIDHVHPSCLLGLTATPERADGGDIRNDFGGRFTHEIRLPEAIDRALLSPFHYYGIPDAESVDFRQLDWQAGRYRQSQLQEILAANQERGLWVLEQANRYLTDIHQSKALGFCVSKAHARFMAELFSSHGVPARALTDETLQAERQMARTLLERGKINFIFSVDLFNEGVDLPTVDAVLFLRPTESLTVFLQQLGRGLRLDPGKSHLTVLDFVAPQHRNFRYANRFQALTSRSDIRIDTQVRQDMPYVPAGCLIHLERRAKEHILANIAEATHSLRRDRLLAGIRQLQQQASTTLSLSDLLTHFMLDDPDDIYKRGLPGDLSHQASGFVREVSDDIAVGLAKGFRRLLQVDDYHLFNTLNEQIRQGILDEATTPLLYSVLWGDKLPAGELSAVHAYLVERPGLLKDLLDLIQWQQTRLHPHPIRRLPETGMLNLHGSYTRAQIVLALGRGTLQKPFSSREGVMHLPELKVDAFFADVHKSDADFSPTTMYDDYAVTDKLFHWQSQSQTSVESPTGQRYIHHAERGYTPVLFIRERKQNAKGLTSPYFYAGPLTYQRHEGSKPISITWKLETPLPARVLQWARRTG